MEFRTSEPLTYGLELELQIVDPRTGRLFPGCQPLMEELARRGDASPFAHEATLATIEINSSIHRDAAAMAAEMRRLVERARNAARTLTLDLCGGGTNLAQFWNERVMAPTERARVLEGRFGFLPKRFSTYGMHVHVGMPDREAAVRVANVLQALSPLFIALAAASPFLQSADTGFAASRPLEPLVYPHGGPMPFLSNWQALEDEVSAIMTTGLAFTLKDIYWDVRPKPEFGTVEVRVFDTPLRLDKALHLASLTRQLAGLALEGELALTGPVPAGTLRASRFLACRDGLKANLYDPFAQQWTSARTLASRLLGRMDGASAAVRALGDTAQWQALLHSREDCSLIRESWASYDPDPKDDAAMQAALAHHGEVMRAQLLA